jgi:hypothetical protein
VLGALFKNILILILFPNSTLSGQMSDLPTPNQPNLTQQSKLLHEHSDLERKDRQIHSECQKPLTSRYHNLHQHRCENL